MEAAQIAVHSLVEGYFGAAAALSALHRDEEADHLIATAEDFDFFGLESGTLWAVGLPTVARAEYFAVPMPPPPKLRKVTLPECAPEPPVEDG